MFLAPASAGVLRRSLLQDAQLGSAVHGASPVPHLAPSISCFDVGKGDMSNIPALLRAAFKCTHQNNESLMTDSSVMVVNESPDGNYLWHAAIMHLSCLSMALMCMLYQPIDRGRHQDGASCTPSSSTAHVVGFYDSDGNNNDRGGTNVDALAPDCRIMDRDQSSHQLLGNASGRLPSITDPVGSPHKDSKHNKYGGNGVGILSPAFQVMDCGLSLVNSSLLQPEPLSVILSHCITHGQVPDPATSDIIIGFRVSSESRKGLWSQRTTVLNKQSYCLDVYDVANQTFRCCF